MTVTVQILNTISVSVEIIKIEICSPPVQYNPQVITTITTI
jgi:hypothetical protein